MGCGCDAAHRSLAGYYPLARWWHEPRPGVQQRRLLLLLTGPFQRVQEFNDPSVLGIPALTNPKDGEDDGDDGGEDEANHNEVH